MKKIFVWAMLLLIGTHFSYGQIQKGKFLIGLGIQGNGYLQKFEGSNYNYFRGAVSLPVGFFITDSWLIGFQPSLGKFFSKGDIYEGNGNYFYTLLPYISRYWKLNDKWYFDLQLSAGYGRENHQYGMTAYYPDEVNSRVNYHDDQFHFHLSPGINYLIGQRAMLRFNTNLFSLIYTKHTNPGSNSSSLTYGLNAGNNATLSFNLLF